MKNIVTVLAIVLLLSGCASQPWYKEPAIVDISDSKVVVQSEHSNLPGNMFASKNTATIHDIKRVAESGCSNYEGKKARLLSESCGRTVYDQLSGNVCAATNDGTRKVKSTKVKSPLSRSDSLLLLAVFPLKKESSKHVTGSCRRGIFQLRITGYQFLISNS